MSKYNILAFYGLVTLFTLLFFYFLAPILPPFLMGMALAYLGDPIVDRFEEWGLSRTAGVSIVFSVMVLIAILALLVLAPMIEHQIRVVIESIPAALEKLNTFVIPYIANLTGTEIPEINMASITEGVRRYWDEIGGMLGLAAGWLGSSTQVLIALVASATITPVVSFYLLRDWDILVAKIHDLLPRNVEPKIVQLAKEMDAILAEFLRGQLLLMLAQTTYFAIALSLIGLKLSLLVAIIAGGLSFVPYLGVIIGVAAGVIAAAMQFQGVLPIILVLVIFGVGQVLEGVVLQPILIGDRIGMHPVAVIFAVMAGGQLFGFVGVLIALPVAAVITVLIRHIHDFYKGSQFYHHEVSAVVPTSEGSQTPEMLDQESTN